MNYDIVIQQNTDQSFKKNGKSVLIHIETYSRFVLNTTSLYMCANGFPSFSLLSHSFSEMRSHYVALVSLELAT